MTSSSTIRRLSAAGLGCNAFDFRSTFMAGSPLLQTESQRQCQIRSNLQPLLNRHIFVTRAHITSNFIAVLGINARVLFPGRITRFLSCECKHGTDLPFQNGTRAQSNAEESSITCLAQAQSNFQRHSGTPHSNSRRWMRISPGCNGPAASE